MSKERGNNVKKYKTWTEESYTDSIYFNWEFVDEELKDEFETEIGYSSQYSVRLADHKRPPIIDGCCVYEQKYFYDTRVQEFYDLAVKYLTSVLDDYCDKKINISQLDDLLFDISHQDMVKYFESNKKQRHKESIKR